MNSSPSTLLEESLASFSKAAHQAFAAVDEEARTTVAQAVSEAREARRKRDEAGSERDEAVKARHACQLETQSLKEEVCKCKASLEQAELTIAHQEETILHLRRERSQWKDQARNWQKHFLHVEQERCRLSSRVDELVAERLLFNGHIPPVTFTPGSRYGDVHDTTLSSTTTKRTSVSPNRLPAFNSRSPEPASPTMHRNGRVIHMITPSLPRSPAPQPQTTSDATNTRKKSFGRHRKALSHLTISPARDSRQRMSLPNERSEPSQVLIRRVQAVVQIPVKQEDADEELFDSGEFSASDSASEPSGSASKDTTRVARSSLSLSRMKSRTRQTVQSDEEETAPLEDEEEDDELMMGTEDNRKELYGTEPVSVSSVHSQPRNGNAGKSAGPPTKKRKMTAPVGPKPSNKNRR